MAALLVAFAITPNPHSNLELEPGAPLKALAAEKSFLRTLPAAAQVSAQT